MQMSPRLATAEITTNIEDIELLAQLQQVGYFCFFPGGRRPTKGEKG